MMEPHDAVQEGLRKLLEVFSGHVTHRPSRDPTRVQVGIVGGTVAIDVQDFECDQCLHPLPAR